jgi:hypothetical protein
MADKFRIFDSSSLSQIALRMKISTTYEKKDALSIPDPTLRAELLRSYTSSVHAQFPIVDLDKFMDALSRNKFTGWGIGLLLFQAIMFAGAAFVDFQVLQSSGFETRQQIQDLLFSRVKV